MAVAAECPRRGRGGAASAPPNIHVAAATPPRPANVTEVSKDVHLRSDGARALGTVRASRVSSSSGGSGASSPPAAAQRARSWCLQRTASSAHARREAAARAAARRADEEEGLEGLDANWDRPELDSQA